MKTAIHPKWYESAKVTCACGNSFTVGSTIPEIHVEVCSACHPYFTGTMKYIDTAGRVDAFKARMQKVNTKKVSKTEKRKLKKAKKIQEEFERPESLAQLRNQG